MWSSVYYVASITQQQQQQQQPNQSKKGITVENCKVTLDERPPLLLLMNYTAAALGYQLPPAAVSYPIAVAQYRGGGGKRDPSSK